MRGFFGFILDFGRQPAGTSSPSSSKMSKAARQYGFADTCWAAGKLLKNGHFTSFEDLASYCSRLGDPATFLTYNGTSVDLGVYDSLLWKEGD